MSFDPNATGVPNGNYFGFEFGLQESALALVSVPWDVTVSYRDGTSGAPRAIAQASTQVEIFDAQYSPDLWRKGIFTEPIDGAVQDMSKTLRRQAEQVIAHIEAGGSAGDAAIEQPLKQVNRGCAWLRDTIYNRCKELLAAGHRVGLVGGDHSTPLGLIAAVAEQHQNIGILHIDAHMDLRECYEGFEFSHASIMFNALKIKGVTHLVQVGVRDFSQQELDFALADARITQFEDRELWASEFLGTGWDAQCERIVAALPKNVYVSFDVDGLERAYCPCTGTPVPGGLTYPQATYLLNKLAKSGRQIVGFDLNEVTPDPGDQWDAIVGARLLYKLCLMTLDE